MTNLIQFLPPYTQKHSYTRNNDKKFIQPYPPTARNKRVQAQVVWNKLYKRELLDNEFFQETGTEDTEFNCRIYQKSCQAVIIDIPMYYWVQRPTSITHQKVNPVT